MLKKVLFMTSLLLPAVSYSSSLEKEDIAVNNLTHSMLKDDANTFLRHGKSMFFADIGNYSSSEIIADYRNNELYANKKYFNKALRVTGKASEIRADSSGNGIIEMGNTGYSTGLRLHIDGDSEYAINLTKGAPVDVICVGGKLTNGVPVMQDCSSASEYTDTLSNAYLSGLNKNPDVRAIFYSILKGNEAELYKPCLTGAKECLDALQSLVRSGVNPWDKAEIYLRSHYPEIEKKHNPLFN
ncbi:hypothetical protein ABN242_16830 [Providencia alcalifaciens]|uniref:OB-fold protein n=1 Tax=Providencia alcalifaciens TaxID=126385 RepID=UPI0032DA7FFD